MRASKLYVVKPHLSAYKKYCISLQSINDCPPMATSLLSIDGTCPPTVFDEPAFVLMVLTAVAADGGDA